MFVSSDSHFPVASSESARLLALDEYAVFDTPPDADLDRLVELAARMYGTPVAALSLVGRERLYFKSRYGMQATGIGREGSFCSYAIQNDGLFLVPDAAKDERFADQPLVKEPPKIRFYAGIPLVAPTGSKIGTLCVLDTKPWPEFTEADRKNLEDVADLVMNRLELRRIDKAKQGGHQRFEYIASTSPNPIVCADSAGQINYWNRAAENLFGYKAAEVMGKPIGLIFPEQVRNLQTAEVMSLVNCGASEPGTWQLGVLARRSDGTEFPAELSVSTWRDSEGVSFGAVIRDATDHQEGEQRLFGLAHLDPLTGLPSRSLLIERLQETVENEAGTLMLLDLQGFKDVNDLLGHSTGDVVLTETAGRLRTLAGPGATVARIGADEFAVLRPDLMDNADAARHAEELLQRVATPMSIGGRSVNIGADIGIAMCPEHGTSSGEILANADLALQRARTTLGSRFVFFTPALRRAVKARRAHEADLRRALDEQQFELFYQPQVRLADREIIGVEALLRWRHPERGLLVPGDFLSVLESNPISVGVGEWVLNTACAHASAWRRMGGRELRVSVNLFETQFNDAGLSTRVEQALLKNDLPASALELEITENIMLRHDESLTVPLREMCAWGVGIAFDDYGTGYASLSLLKRYPVTRLKIDRSFVRNVCTDSEDAAIVQAIMYLGRRFGLGIIAEGIENEAQDEALRLYGCTEAQGFLYGRPMSVAALTDLLRQDRERTVA